MITIKSDDNLLVNNLLNHLPQLLKDEANQMAKEYSEAQEKIEKLQFDYPFDQKTEDELRKLLPLNTNETLYRKVETLKSLWRHLLDKSIKCLRFFDKREPYLNIDGKAPQSYGLEDLITYYEEFAQFEALLYGSNQFYRDHVIHLFRTWLIGMNILLNKNKDDCLYKQFSFEGISLEKFNINLFECISMWTVASLCHDLGYPLEKFKEVINKTQKMMEYVVSQPKIHQDITFSGTQDKLNENILRLISSKMTEAKPTAENNERYHARTQSKYFMKYSKSLEEYKHGIISAIIIYKALLYFLESDFSTHDDYTFDFEDAKQFYLRRDILRSISSHTCWDIYHMHPTTFSFLLILSDELQQWGRKSWHDIYRSQKLPSTKFSLVEYSRSHVAVEYEFGGIQSIQAGYLISFFYNQFKKYRMLFRDGLDTENRSFSFYVIYSINLDSGKKITVTTMIPSEASAYFKIASKDYEQKGTFAKVIEKDKYSKEPINEKDNEFNIVLA